MSDPIFSKNGSKYISDKIEEAIENGSRTAVITGKYEIDTAVSIPSNFTLILENAHLRLADGVFSNIFINEPYITKF